jgi:hypothetical protein
VRKFFRRRMKSRHTADVVACLWMTRSSHSPPHLEWSRQAIISTRTRKTSHGHLTIVIPRLCDGELFSHGLLDFCTQHESENGSENLGHGRTIDFLALATVAQ